MEDQTNPNQDPEQAPIPTGPVTLAEVRAVTPDPFTTNANRVRELIGRGSNATIQKHLEKLRAELQREREIEEGEAPEAPESVIQGLWVTAWNAANAQVKNRMEQLSTERDAYRETAEAATADAHAQAEALDEARTQAEQQAQEREAEQLAAAAALANAQEQATADLTQAKTQAEAQATAAAEQLAQVQAQAKAQADADADRIRELEHAAALADRDRQLERKTLQTEIDRMSNQLAQTQALLWKEREPKPEPEKLS